MISSISNVQHHWQLGLDNPLLWGSVLCIVECWVASLVSTHQIPVATTHYQTLTIKNVSVCMCSAAAAAKLLQSGPTLCNPIDGSPAGSPIPGTLQARTLEWVAISFSNAWKWKWSRSVVSNSSRPHGLQPSRLLCPWDFLGKSTGVGCHRLLLRGTYSVPNAMPCSEDNLVNK